MARPTHRASIVIAMCSIGRYAGRIRPDTNIPVMLTSVVYHLAAILEAPITGSGASTTTVIGAAAEYTLAHKANTSDENQNLPEVRQEASDDSLNDYPANPDDWRVPEGWTETSAGEKTGSKHRQWNGSKGKVRRWDREGSRV